ncbi:uncharacterized protein LOC131666585 [Phymastichus coffea]|uniref:uncharacterized protein LOC131666585 n=1 Tax=Phymastichus coffea TaxID=108790 RepID=UPI00273C956A|nr:uncharacterized protein LOC131666585 [Phymastichus coffea]
MISALLLVLATVVFADGEWTVHNFNRSLVHPLKDAKDNFVYVTFSLNDHEAIKLNFQDERKSCVVPHELPYNTRSKHKVAALGNGKVIVTMMNNQMNRARISDAITKFDWKLSIIDPNNCSYQHKIIGHVKTSFDNILPYVDTFDLYAKSNQISKVLRFKDNGELEGFSAIVPDKKGLGIKVAKEYDPSQGYYYVVPNRKKSQSIIKKLNSHFQVTKTYVVERDRLSQDPQSYSMNYGRITFCYFTGNRMNLECAVINGELDRELLKIRLIYEHALSGTTVVNFRHGFAVVHYQRHKNQMSTVYARRVSEAGEIGSVVKIGEVTDAIHYVYSFVMNDGKLCVVVTFGDAVLTKYIDLD